MQDNTHYQSDAFTAIFKNNIMLKECKKMNSLTVLHLSKVLILGFARQIRSGLLGFGQFAFGNKRINLIFPSPIPFKRRNYTNALFLVHKPAPGSYIWRNLEQIKSIRRLISVSIGTFYFSFIVRMISSQLYSDSNSQAILLLLFLVVISSFLWQWKRHVFETDLFIKRWKNEQQLLGRLKWLNFSAKSV